MLDNIAQALADLEDDQVLAAVNAALEAGAAPADILAACQKGMVRVGDKFAAGEYFISDLMYAADIFKRASSTFASALRESGNKGAGTVVVGTAKGDIHDIGKDLVVSMLRAANYDVTDLGVDVPPEKFIDAVKQTGAQVVGLSGLLTISFDSMRAIVEAFKTAGLRDSLKVMIGGGPTDAGVCSYVGADDWGHDATDAIRLCKNWIKE